MGLFSSKSSGHSAASGGIENVLGRSAVVHGDMKAEGAFRIDGTVEGCVESGAAVIIGEAGVVRGDVRGTDVVIAGQVVGSVYCSGHLEIVATGKVDGDVEARSLRIETGGVFRGTSRMGDESAGSGSKSETNLRSVS